METIKLEDFIKEYWKNEDYKEYTFVFGNTIANRDMLDSCNMYIQFEKSKYFPKVWGEVREREYGFYVGVQFDFTEVRILESGNLVFHLKIDLPEEEVL